MKLHNKNTGEIKEGVEISIWLDHEGTSKFRSLAELNEEWEDYEPKEPLIKDEKIREIVRPWAKVNGTTELKYYEGENCLEDVFRNEIHFNQALGLEDAKTYTTEELCGEKE